MWHNTLCSSTSSSEDASSSFLGSTHCASESSLTCSLSPSSTSTTPSSIFPLHPLPPSIIATLYPLLITDEMLEQAIGILQQQRRTREALYQGWKSSARRNGEIPTWIFTPVKQAHESFLAAIDQEETRLLQLLWTRRVVDALNYPQIPPITTKRSPVEKPKRRRYRRRKPTSLVEQGQSPTEPERSLLEFLEDATQVIMRLLGYSEADSDSSLSSQCEDDVLMIGEAVPEEKHLCKKGGSHESSDSMEEDRPDSESVDVSHQASPDSARPSRLYTRDGTIVSAYCRVRYSSSGDVYYYHKILRESIHELPEDEDANSEDELEYDRLHQEADKNSDDGEEAEAEKFEPSRKRKLEPSQCKGLLISYIQHCFQKMVAVTKEEEGKDEENVRNEEDEDGKNF